MQLDHSLAMVNGISSNLVKWQRLMKRSAEIFTPGSSLPTTSFPLMVIFGREFSMSWSLRSISFGADLQPVIGTLSCSDDFDEHALARVLLLVSFKRSHGGLSVSIMPRVTTAVESSSRNP
jgi:hypothetical protein